MSTELVALGDGEELLARFVDEPELLKGFELDRLIECLMADPAFATDLRCGLEIHDLLAQRLAPGRAAFVSRVCAAADELTGYGATHSIRAARGPLAGSLAPSHQETAVAKMELSDLLWKYFQYAKFAFMLIALWIFLSFHRSCSVSFVPRENYQMAPNYGAGNTLIVSDPTLCSLDAGLEKGDAVVWGDPYSRDSKGEIMHMGRIIAVPGERVRAYDGEVFVNGKKVSEAIYLKNKNREPFTVAEVVVPAGHVFILVDNRQAFHKFRYRKAMRDSRHRGPIPIWAIKAKITSKFKYAN